MVVTSVRPRPRVRAVFSPFGKYTAIDAATTHLYEPGLRTHIRNALRYGATKEEIMEVLELVSVLGIHSCTLGVPVLLEELEALERERSSDADRSG